MTADGRAGRVLKIAAGLAAACVAAIVGLIVVAAVAERRARTAWLQVDMPADESPRSPQSYGVVIDVAPSNDIPMSPDDAAIAAPFATLPKPEMDQFGNALSTAVDEDSALPSPALTAWLAAHRDALDRVASSVLSKSSPPEWGRDMFRTSYRGACRMLLADAVVASSAGDPQRAERDLEAHWRLWSWSKPGACCPPPGVLAALRQIRPLDPAWVERLQPDAPLGPFFEAAREQAAERWDGKLDDGRLERLYRYLPRGPQAIAGAVVVRPLFDTLYAQRSRHVALAVAQVVHHGDCLPPLVQQLVRTSPGASDLPASAYGLGSRLWVWVCAVNYGRPVASAVPSSVDGLDKGALWAWANAVDWKANILLTRAVLRESGLAIPPDAAPCADWGVETVRLDDGRIRVSLRGTVRDLFPMRSRPADFTFTPR